MLVLTFTLCLLLISTSCQANIYERLSDANPCLSKYGVNEGYGEKQERIVNTIHIVSQNVRIEGNKIYYDLGFDGEVSLENADLMRFNFHITLPNGMDKISPATLTNSSQDEDYVCHFEFTGNATVQYNITLQNAQSAIVAAAENTVIDWSNLITLFESDTIISIVSERAYIEKSGLTYYIYVEIVFDKPVLLPRGMVEFNLSGFNSTGISNGQQIFNVITFNGNSVKLRRNRSFNSGSMGFIGNGVVNYVDGEYIVGDNNYMINWGDDYLTRNIFDNSRIYSQGE